MSSAAAGGESAGAALFILNVDVVVEDCLFEDCVGGGLFLDGVDTQTGVVRVCTFRNNTGASALSARDLKSLTVQGCAFVGNNSNPYNGGGAGVHVSEGSSLAITSCVFLHNVAVGIGGAASATGSGFVHFEANTVAASGGVFDGSAVRLAGTVIVRGNIIASTSGSGAAMDVLAGSTVTGQCNLFWNNADGDYVNYVPDSTDLFVDPLFCDEEQGDLRLRPESPCLPENSNGCELIGALGAGCGSVSVTPTSWGRLKNRYRLPRQ